MTRHITDHPRQGTADRLRKYLALDRQDTPHPTTRSLRTRGPAPDKGRRLREFLRIVRGRMV
jgi:hypothetical protein